MTAYKLTDAKGQTHGETQWGPGVTHTAPGTGGLCSAGWIHVYSDPLLAVLLDPIHGKFGGGARLWRCEVSGNMLNDHGLNQGWSSVTTVEEMPLPEVTIEQRVLFGILCAKRVCGDRVWNAWADAWLSGEDRSRAAAWAAAAAAWAAEAEAAAAWAAEAAGWAAEWEAAEAAWAAVAPEAVHLDLPALARQAMEVK